MTGGTEALPLKVCRHCSVASRTHADRCPNCDRPYARGGWRWWMIVPIVAIAFAGGYFGLSKLVLGDDEAGVISREEGEAVKPGISPNELESTVGEPPEFTDSRGQGPARLDCSYYAIEGEEDAAWEFCFRRGELLTSNPVVVE